MWSICSLTIGPRFWAVSDQLKPRMSAAGTHLLRVRECPADVTCLAMEVEWALEETLLSHLV
eukprot:6211109-Pleurochrysis_carterae.AAC.1